ncbi:tonsoku-like protein, partial [Aphidius gifuensis]|uniref:tonsoku-like protein n=1 Tax=Aphidius gifuensis TaxID=684658 RepID=UPI001CDC40D8
KKDKERAKRKNNARQLSTILRSLGDEYTEEGKYNEALDEYNELLDVCETLDDALSIAVAHRMIGETLMSLGDYANALDHQKNYLKGVKDTNNLLEQQRAFATLGRTQFCLGESLTDANDLTKKIEVLNNAKRSYAKSLELCNKLERNNSIKLEEIMIMRSRLFLNLGLVYEAKKEPKNAIELIEKAAQLCEQHNLSDDLYRSHIALGGIYERMNNNQLAQCHYEEASKVSDPGLKALAKLACAEYFIKVGKFIDAREILVKLYVHHNDDTIITTSKKLLKIIVVIEKCEEMLQNEFHNNKRLEIYEKAGDAAIAGQSLKKAIEYYRSMLSCARTAESTSKISAALVSLAQTLKDTEQYDEALLYAKEELKICKDPNEISRSALFLAELLSHTDSSNEEIISTLEIALDNANKSDKPLLKLDVLKEMREFYHKNNNKKKYKEIDKEIENISENLSIISTQDEEQDEIGDDINLSDLSDIEDEIIKRDGDKSKIKRQPKRNSNIQIKRNLKGETQLQTACIDGDIDKVKEYLAAKHPVNVRDNCGWTPLHEATNFGYVDIVKLLIKHGADVNDPGGAQCGGITPLHDAAACGHTIMINLLMENGADPRLVTHKGETVLDCLVAWRERVENLSQYDENEYKKICDKLRLILPSKSLKNKKSNDNELAVAQPRLFPSIIDHEDPDDDLRLSNDDEPVDKEGKFARKVYKRAIESMKHPLRSNQIICNNSKTISQPPPLIDSEEVLIDEWLEDDIGNQPSTSTSAVLYKKRRSSNGLGSCITPESTKKILTSSSSNSSAKKTPTSAKRRTNNFSPIDDINAKRQKINDDLLADVLLIDSEDSQSSTLSEDLFQTSPFSKKHKKSKQKSLFTNGFTKNTILKSRSPSPVSIVTTGQNYQRRSTDTIKIQITINDRIYNLKLRSSEQNKTLVLNIQNDINDKFELDTGCSGKIILTTLSGDDLTADNILNVIFSSDGVVKLIGNVDDLKIPTLTERYKKIYDDIDGIPETMLKSLKSCENTSTFRLRNSNNFDKEIITLLKSLEYEKNIQVLYLSSGSLFNIGNYLGQTLVNLSSLQELHLQCCDIDYNCLSYIYSLPLSMRVLDLSYNPLGRESQDKLVDLITPLRNLQTLNLCCCKIDKFPVSAISCSILNLDISNNTIDDESVDGYLQRQMINLNLSNIYWKNKTIGTLVLSTTNDRIFMNLDILELSGCKLTNFDVKYIIKKCHNITKINISNNQDINDDAVGELLSKKPTLSLIDVTGCTIINNNPGDDVIIDKPQVCTLKVSMSKDVIDYWKFLWLGQASIYHLSDSTYFFEPSLE